MRRPARPRTLAPWAEMTLATVGVLLIGGTFYAVATYLEAVLSGAP